MIKSNKKFADVPVHIYEYLPLISPFLIPSASPLLALVFPLLFFITLVSFPLFLLIFLNPFPSPLVFSPICTSLHSSHSFSPSIHIHPLFPFTLPVVPVFLSSSFLLHLPCHSSSLSRFLSPFSFPLSLPFSPLYLSSFPLLSFLFCFPVPLTLPLPSSSPLFPALYCTLTSAFLFFFF